MAKIREKIRLSKISVFHFIKLGYRSALFLAALAAYIHYRIRTKADILTLLETHPVVFALIWLVFFAEMLMRFFPSSIESPGCQKIFAKNYRPTEKKTNHPPLPPSYSVPLIAVMWILLTFGIGLLYVTGVIDLGIVVLISLCFLICDLVCILFFCPFQEWIMKNKCCGTCRIYNWDFAMMFSPFIFVKSLYTISLFVMSIALFVEWEIIYFRHPERFVENTNASLSCANCPEKLCSHKQSLQRFLQKQHIRFFGKWK